MTILNFRSVDEIDDGPRIKMAKNLETGWVSSSSVFTRIRPVLRPPSPGRERSKKRDTTAEQQTALRHTESQLTELTDSQNAESQTNTA